MRKFPDGGKSCPAILNLRVLIFYEASVSFCVFRLVCLTVHESEDHDTGVACQGDGA